ncbi:plasmid partitioning protein RepB [Chelatococcus asaccharovorans]|uniref:plasmid partitioning protein RepB n=1 Tax=Chelatococcus asaccharovorans TaxID=28210 RepID=UPI00224C689A|nr:plasmid partitioning protein RepB [Chelatococcus asaccharovorans]CAH1658752.1 putative replication protein B [Chelatococcus asaccharovorans]CAH1688417.1 putative replication protein B [Chelatococcus asaccharovorans]
MARRNIFQNIKEAENREAERPAASGYTARGATRNMLASIGELAEKAARADQIIEGASVIELDPELVDSSFVSDRMDDDGAFGELLEAIRERGQDSPILVRPHPADAGRYQIVFGHRRVRAARQLGRKVRAVVRTISNTEHVIAQGQENSARENLSFIERALFAQRLVDQGYDRPTVQAALAVDAPMLTRMLSVSGRVPEDLAVAIGSCKTIGRDRWLTFAQLVESPDARQAALDLAGQPGFSELASEARFEKLHAELRARAKRRGSAAKPIKDKWQPEDRAIAVELTDTGRSFSVAFKSKGGAQFGRFVAESLERLYGEYKQRNNEGKG